jgi:hypothetical protein
MPGERSGPRIIVAIALISGDTDDPAAPFPRQD